MQVIFLHDMEQLKERAKTIPFQLSYRVSASWFSDSEQIVLADEWDKFQIFNVLAPEKPVISIDMELQNNQPPKVVLNDRIIIL